jgi:hypothetical protein
MKSRQKYLATNAAAAPKSKTTTMNPRTQVQKVETMTAKEKRALKAEAVSLIRENLNGANLADLAGVRVYTLVTHVSKSGMSRRIRTLIVRNGAILDLSPFVARACGWRYHADDHAVVVAGCGMDMGFHIVDTLSHVLGLPLAHDRL